MYYDILNVPYEFLLHKHSPHKPLFLYFHSSLRQSDSRAKFYVKMRDMV